MSKFLLIVLLYNLFVFIWSVQSNSKTAEERLLEHILTNRSVDARPVRNAQYAINVKFGVELIQLVNLNEKDQQITTKLWVRQEWMNELMKWDPAKWGYVNEVNVEGGDIWKPDILLHNNAEGGFGGSTEKFKALIQLQSGGVNKWLSPAQFVSTCKINVKNFPFDTQTCMLKFGSWSYDSSKLNISRHTAPLISTQYLNSSTWDIIDIKTEFNSVVYNCCPNPYQDITFTFVFRRRPLYYVFNAIIPCMVLVSMVLFGFFLPPESGERLSLNITILLALAVFMQFLSDALPKNSDSTPLLSLCFITLMAESAIALITTIVVLSIHHKGENGTSPPPMWTRKLFLYGGFSGRTRRRSSNIHLHFTLNSAQQYGIALDAANSGASVPLMNSTVKSIQKLSLTKQEDIIVCSLRDILKGIEKINQSIKEQERQDDVAQEWRTLAKAVDRLFFVLFLMVFIVSGAGTLLQIYGTDAFNK